MAELLVRNVDKVNPDSEASNRMCFKRGDVITVQENGWPWSPAELAGDPWTIVKFVGGTVPAAEEYLRSKYGPDDEIVLPRDAYFDLDAALPQTQFLGGDAQMLAYKVVKP